MSKPVLSEKYWIVILLLISLPFSVTAQEKSEKWMEENNSRLLRADRYAETLLHPEKIPVTKAPPQKRWHLFGKTGVVFDSNVPLASDNKAFRAGHEATHAFYFPINAGAAFDVYSTEKTKAGLSYIYSYYPHTGELESFNFQNHEASIYLNRSMTAWNRPALLRLRYSFSHGLLDAATYSSSHFWMGTWVGEWAQNFLLTAYERMGIENFRDKGFDKSISSRDGYYSQTGLSQTYLFDQRRRSASIGYELGIDAPRGKDFDALHNALLLKFKNPVVEKFTFENSFLFQDSYYRHFAVVPKRHDQRYQLEFRLSHPLGKYVTVSTFYRWTKVNNPHEGVLGQFSYNRHVGGVEFTYAV